MICPGVLWLEVSLLCFCGVITNLDNPDMLMQVMVYFKHYSNFGLRTYSVFAFIFISCRFQPSMSTKTAKQGHVFKLDWYCKKELLKEKCYFDLDDLSYKNHQLAFTVQFGRISFISSCHCRNILSQYFERNFCFF